jgi:hypothetical protein
VGSLANSAGTWALVAFIVSLLLATSAQEADLQESGALEYR